MFVMAVMRLWLCVSMTACAVAATNQPLAPKPDAIRSQNAKTHVSRTTAHRNIVLITLDTTRADRMGFLGSKRGLTPNLDALARQSAVFTRAYAQAPLTSVSHATILTGTYPQFHGVVDFPMVLAKDLPYAPEILRGHGYHTAAFLGSLALDPKGGAPGFERGFDTYDANFHPEDMRKKGRYHSIERRGDEVLARALAWLNKHPKGPFFLWVHLYDAHDPYDPPEPYKTRYAPEPYDGGIAYEDAVVGKLMRQLKARGLYSGAVIAVMADHGESLGAHGEDTHGVFIYDETIQVPLVIKLPQAKAAGERIENKVELADVLPTLLETTGIEVPPEVQGKSLLGLMKAGTEEDTRATEAWSDSAYAQADYAHLAYGWAALQSWRTGKYLYIQAPHRELYDESVDPKAEHNLASASTAVADTLAGKLQDFREKTTSTRQAPKATLDPARAKDLAALGYVVSGSNAAKAGPSEQGADPKDRIATVNTIRELNFVMEEGRYADAIPVLQKLAAEYPDMSMVHFKLGTCYMELHDFANAVPSLRKATKLEPDFTMAQMDLGESLMRIQGFDEAATAFENVAARIPNLMDAQLLLEIAYARANRLPEAIRQSQKVLQILPEHFGSYMILGRSLAKSGDLEGAIPKLQKAATLRPASPEPHIALADVYDHFGREEDAARERAEAMRLGAVPVDQPGPTPYQAPGSPEQP
jgi:arylsulfatase A-like enzyme/cytochrome c-type biogenesis protein CcmH/NrfG